jgi:anaerobic magnesium-protoporphyrin IX monomethyl ester cyclase
MIIVRPNNDHRYQKLISKTRAIEPPLWHIICADYFKSDCLIDLEVENLNIDEFNNTWVLNTGNNPTAFGHDKLPMNPIDYKPRWDLIDLKKYRAHDWHTRGYDKNSPYGVLYTSISCPFTCKFCFSKDFYPVGYSERPLKDIISDLEYFHSQKVTHVKIIDEIFVLRKERVKEICWAIIKSGYKFNFWCYARLDTVDRETLRIMKEAGINWIGYGIESGNEDIRRENGKGMSNPEIKRVVQMTRGEGISSACNFIFGFERDTIDTMQQTLDFAYELDCEYANFYCLVDKNVNQLSKEFLPRHTIHCSSEQVLEFRDKAASQYYQVPRLERDYVR